MIIWLLEMIYTENVVCFEELECYKEEPEGDVETEVNVTVPEVKFLEDTLPPLLPPSSSSPVKTVTPSNGEGPMEVEEEEETQKSSRITSVSGEEVSCHSEVHFRAILLLEICCCS